MSGRNTRTLLPPIKELEFQAQIVQLAKLYKWRCYHAFDSRKSEVGWPDLFLCKPPRLLALELKTAKGRRYAAAVLTGAVLGCKCTLCELSAALSLAPEEWVR